MPRNGSVGYSENTPKKQEHLRMILATHMTIVQSIMRRNAWVSPRYIALDLNAGAGRYPDTLGQQIIGSPMNYLDVARITGLPLWMLCCEQNAHACTQLRSALVNEGMSEQAPDIYAQGSTWTWIYEGDHHFGVPTFLRHLALQRQRKQQHYFGLIYSDENGALPPFDLLGTCATELPFCDILVHVAATPIKRQFYSPLHPLQSRLDEMIDTITKKYWMVREPYGRHQWTFFIGTNWDSFPQFRRQDFWPVESREGRSILRRLSYNRKDRYGQGDLFLP